MIKLLIFTRLVEENQKTIAYTSNFKNCNEEKLIYKYIVEKIS